MNPLLYFYPKGATFLFSLIFRYLDRIIRKTDLSNPDIFLTFLLVDRFSRDQKFIKDIDPSEFESKGGFQKFARDQPEN